MEVVPGSQVVAQAASALVVPFIAEMWAPHVGVECTVQLVLSSTAEYSPKGHGEHAESEDSDPAA